MEVITMGIVTKILEAQQLRHAGGAAWGGMPVPKALVLMSEMAFEQTYNELRTT